MRDVTEKLAPYQEEHIKSTIRSVIGGRTILTYNKDPHWNWLYEYFTISNPGPAVAEWSLNEKGRALAVRLRLEGKL